MRGPDERSEERRNESERGTQAKCGRQGSRWASRRSHAVKGGSYSGSIARACAALGWAGLRLLLQLWLLWLAWGALQLSLSLWRDGVLLGADMERARHAVDLAQVLHRNARAFLARRVTDAIGITDGTGGNLSMRSW